MTEPEGNIPGNHTGTVAVAKGDQHRLQAMARAIRCLEAFRAGLLEAGHPKGTTRIDLTPTQRTEPLTAPSVGSYV